MSRKSNNNSKSHRIERHIRSRMLSGLFVLIPFGITVLVIRFLGSAVASFLRPFVKALLGPTRPGVEMAISVVAFLLLVYLVGLVAAHIAGRRLVAIGENIVMKIPIVKTIYAASKQMVETFSLSNRSSFQSVVYVGFPSPNVNAIGFVTGTSRAPDGRLRYRVFVPTAPNPTSGFLLIIDADKVTPTRLSVEDAIKLVISGGVLGPEKDGQAADA